MSKIFDGLRVIAHFYSLLFHFSCAFIISKEDKIPIILLHLHRFFSQYFSVIFFVINGIYSARSITNIMNKMSSQFPKIMMKFYFERLALILPITYIYYLIFSIIISILPNNYNLIEMQKKSFFPNLFFISNFYQIESNVNTI